jgi:hypothetical protein
MQLRPELRRKYIILGGVILLVLALAYRFIPVVESLTVPQEHIELKVQKLARYKAVAEEGKLLERQYGGLLRELASLESGLIAGKTNALVAAHIQNVINEIAENNEVEIESMRVLNPETVKESPYVMIPVQFRLKSSISKLRGVLYEIEEPSKSLNIRDLQVGTYGKGTGEVVSALFTVEGIMKKP